MKTEKFTFTGCGSTKLSASIWTPDGQPKAILQIAHGTTFCMKRQAATPKKCENYWKMCCEINYEY